MARPRSDVISSSLPGYGRLQVSVIGHGRPRPPSQLVSRHQVRPAVCVKLIAARECQFSGAGSIREQFLREWNRVTCFPADGRRTVAGQKEVRRMFLTQALHRAVQQDGRRF
jgi:hypothetical protein